jgi:spermidine synthase
VIDDTAKKERYLRNQKKDVSQGGMSLTAPEKLLLEYTQLSFIALTFLDREPKDVLFVGLGAGAMPRYFNRHYPEASVDIVEIDADIMSAATRFFYFKETANMKVHITDGRMFIKRTQKKYDVIFLDAYQNDDIPFHLTTVEFLREVKGKLKDDGVVAANILSPYRNKFFDSMVMTYKKVFPHLYIFAGQRSRNFVFVAPSSQIKKSAEDTLAKAKGLQTVKKFDIDLPKTASAYEYSTDYEWSSAKVLTDDFAPVNLYKHQKSDAQ